MVLTSGTTLSSPGTFLYVVQIFVQMHTIFQFGGDLNPLFVFCKCWGGPLCKAQVSGFKDLQLGWSSKLDITSRGLTKTCGRGTSHFFSPSIHLSFSESIFLLLSILPKHYPTYLPSVFSFPSSLPLVAFLWENSAWLQLGGTCKDSWRGISFSPVFSSTQWPIQQQFPRCFIKAAQRTKWLWRHK